MLTHILMIFAVVVFLKMSFNALISQTPVPNENFLLSVMFDIVNQTYELIRQAFIASLYLFAFFALGLVGMGISHGIQYLVRLI